MIFSYMNLYMNSGTEVPEVLSALYEPAERSWRTALGQHELEYLLLLVV